MSQDLPAVLDAADAKSLAQDMLRRAWAGRDKLALRLPPSRLALEPGSKLELPLYPALWTIDAVKVDAFAVIATLRPSTSGGAVMSADGGRFVHNSDIAAGPLSLALLDLPDVLGISSGGPILLLAATTASAGWKRRTVQIEFGGQHLSMSIARSKSVLGRAASSLALSAAELIDEQSNVDVTLIDAEQWLSSCDDEALAAGENLALLGSELIQFGQATSLGAGRFRLSRLLRGRGGTESACADHNVDDLFVLISGSNLRPVALPAWSVGALVTATSPYSPSTSIDFSGKNLRPFSPVNLIAASQDTGDLVLNWTRRSRQGLAWIDGIDAPLGEMREQYGVLVAGTVSSAEMFADQTMLTIPAAEVGSIGAGPATIEVWQIGDFAASPRAIVHIILS